MSVIFYEGAALSADYEDIETSFISLQLALLI